MIPMLCTLTLQERSERAAMDALRPIPELQRRFEQAGRTVHDDAEGDYRHLTRGVLSVVYFAPTGELCQLNDDAGTAILDDKRSAIRRAIEIGDRLYAGGPFKFLRVQAAFPSRNGFQVNLQYGASGIPLPATVINISGPDLHVSYLSTCAMRKSPTIKPVAIDDALIQSWMKDVGDYFGARRVVFATAPASWNREWRWLANMKPFPADDWLNIFNRNYPRTPRPQAWSEVLEPDFEVVSPNGDAFTVHVHGDVAARAIMSITSSALDGSTLGAGRTNGNPKTSLGRGRPLAVPSAKWRATRTGIVQASADGRYEVGRMRDGWVGVELADAPGKPIGDRASAQFDPHSRASFATDPSHSKAGISGR